jgi:hypothetical protein
MIVRRLRLANGYFAPCHACQAARYACAVAKLTSGTKSPLKGGARLVRRAQKHQRFAESDELVKGSL